MPKKILITGICGMIGTVLSKWFLDAGYKIYGIDNLSEGYEENLDERVSRLYDWDIRNVSDVNWVVQVIKPDIIIHTAAEAAEILSPFIRNETISTNCLGSTNLINAAINNNIDYFLFFSSIARYGEGNPPFKETDTLNPKDIYASTKIFTEQDLKQAYEHFELKYSILTCFNVTSPYQNYNSLYRNALAIFIRQSILGQDITVYGSGEQIRSFSSCEFICKPIQNILESNNQFVDENFNLGSSLPISINTAAEIVQKEAIKRGYNPKIVHLEARKEVKVAYCDTSKAQRLLGLNDKTDLSKLVSQMFDSALKRNIKDLPVKKRKYEINQGIYSYWK